MLALMCKRAGVPAVQGRGLDDLPEEQKVRAAESLARSLEPAELNRAFRVTMGALALGCRFALSCHCFPAYTGSDGSPGSRTRY